VAKRIVYALEFIDVDVQDRELLAAPGAFELVFQLVVEKRPIGQIGQPVKMRHVRDPLVRAFPLGDILQRRNPAAIYQRRIDDLDRPVACRLHDFMSHALVEHGAKHGGAVLVDIATERAGLVPIGNDIAEMAPGFHDVRRQIIHFQIPLVAKHHPGVGVV
jgi:hypothetical protein